jgi:hypothetical protein
MIGKLLRQCLIEEIPAQGGLPVWPNFDTITVYIGI